MPEGLPWPPRKQDLERLYLGEKLSASRIAQVYGLKYKNTKVAESTILYQLRRNGIERRDPAEHIRKVTEELADEWVRRYQSGESLKKIAAREFSPATVLLHLRRRGVELRDKVEAQIQAVTKYERRPFRGDSVEKAYLMGLRYGDLDAVSHGRATRVRVSTTHPAMADLFESLFSPYGFVHRYPRNANFTGYEWTLECDLDQSFEFLLEKPSIAELESFGHREFLAFLAGFFDAEGSIFLHKKSSGRAPEINIANTDRQVLEFLAGRLRDVGVSGRFARDEQESKKRIFSSVNTIWRLNVWRFQSVNLLLRLMPLRHHEKVNKSRLALRFRSPISRPENIATAVEWQCLQREIEEARMKFIKQADLEFHVTDRKYE